MIFELRDRVVLRVSGGDALRYLNGQVTQDLTRLREGEREGLPACVTSAKGKLVAVVNVWRDGEVFALDVEASRGEVLRERLERYVVADDVVVELEDKGGELLHFVGCEPGEVRGFSGVRGVRMRRIGEWGWDVSLGEAEREERLGAWGGELGGGELWERLRVERGIPAWGRELGEDTLPPEAGLEATHIDYHKGCYMGQEVISRLKSVGQVNRRLVRLCGLGPVELPEAGAVLKVAGRVESGEVDLRGGSSLNSGVGKITSAARGSDGGVVAMAYVKRGVEAGEFVVEGVGRFRRI